MNAWAGLSLLATGGVIGSVWGYLAGMTDRRRDDRRLVAHNERLRLKNRELHEKCRVLEARDVEMTAFLSIITPTDWEAS